MADSVWVRILPTVPLFFIEILLTTRFVMDFSRSCKHEQKHSLSPYGIVGN
ncbi:MAG: hypothetical protein ABI180_04280 [Microcoleus sp.]